MFWIILGLGFGCNQIPDLFFISDREDFIYMAESTNIPPLSIDSISFYFNNNIEQKPGCIYKNFGVIENNRFYSVNILLINDTTLNKRKYEFLLITYNVKHEVIDSYSFASLDDNTNRLCVGRINSYLTIFTKCDNEEIIKEIDTMGHFRAYSSW